jgi:hypothetical protein
MMDSASSSSGGSSARLTCTPPAAPAALGGGPGSAAAAAGPSGPSTSPTECLLELAAFPAAIKGSCRMGECRRPGSPRNVTFARSADPPPDWLPLLAALPVILLLAAAAACAALLLRSAALFRRRGYQQHRPDAEASGALVQQQPSGGGKPGPAPSEPGRAQAAAGAAKVVAAQLPAATMERGGGLHHTAIQVAVAAADEPAGPAAAGGANDTLDGLQLDDGGRHASGAKDGREQQVLLFEQLYCAVPVSACSLPQPAAATADATTRVVSSAPAAGEQQQEGGSSTSRTSSSSLEAAAVPPLAGAAAGVAADPETAAASPCSSSQPRPAAARTLARHAKALPLRSRHPSGRFPAGGPYLGADCALYEPPRHRAILNRVSGHCPVGQVLGILGPSGSGKSTLLSLVAAAGGGADISDWARTGGRIVLAGSASAAERRALTSYVHQDDLLLPRWGVPAGRLAGWLADARPTMKALPDLCRSVSL